MNLQVMQGLGEFLQRFPDGQLGGVPLQGSYKVLSCFDFGVIEIYGVEGLAFRIHCFGFLQEHKRGPSKARGEFPVQGFLGGRVGNL